MTVADAQDFYQLPSIYGLVRQNENIANPLTLKITDTPAPENRSFDILCSLFTTPVIEFDPLSMDFVNANPSALEFYELTIEELRAKRVHDLHWFGPEDDSHEQGVWFYGEPHTYKKYMMVLDEIEDESSNTKLLIFKDITQGVSTYEDATESADRYQSMFEHANEGIFQSKVEGGYTLVNPALARMYGFQSADEMMQKLIDITGSLYVHSERRYEFMDAILKNGYVTNFESEIYRADRSKIWISENARCVLSPSGEVEYFEGFVEDITDRKILEFEKEKMLAEAIERADHDPLTGLLNHRAFQKRLEQEAERTMRDGKSLAVAVMDLDNFKFFNDAYGHVAGDAVLNTVADHLRSVCRSYDILARFGGDEFAILMPGVSKEVAADFPQRTTQAMEHAGYLPEGYDTRIPLGISIGIAVFPDETDSRLEIIDMAVRRLRAAKAGAELESLGERLRVTYSNSISGFKMLDALVTAVDNKDRYTRRHSEDVSFYAVQIAQAMGLDEDFVHEIQVTGLIHDIGKIGVNDHILRKPGKLTEEEFEAIQQHAVMGAMIVSSAPDLHFTLDGVRYHHERWDGKGYPDGLAGEKIPFMARVLAVADAYSAMTTNRPYRTSMDVDVALGVLRDGAGTQWDETCVAAFLKAMGA